MDEEGYSRRKYDVAANEAKIAKEANMRRGGGIYWAEFRNDENEAARKLEELTREGATEATALNEEYDRLRTQMREAILAVKDFEEKKLGLSRTTI